MRDSTWKGAQRMAAKPQLAHTHSPAFQVSTKTRWLVCHPSWVSSALSSLWPPPQLTQTPAESTGARDLVAVFCDCWTGQ